MNIKVKAIWAALKNLVALTNVAYWLNTFDERRQEFKALSFTLQQWGTGSIAHPQGVFEK